ncbi:MULTISPECIES: hypothetical protein [unclassified Staphylococcus]|uniref:hypothetical protein n=1 Tax=unclassified Staphylococcus TaxID=91994 RepID=UPI0023EF0B7D|nr:MULTISPECIES: hypothetical protein [unclassified Staphylococcus]
MLSDVDSLSLTDIDVDSLALIEFRLTFSELLSDVEILSDVDSLSLIDVDVLSLSDND